MKRFILVSILLIGLSPFLVAQKVIRLGKGGHKVNKPTVSSSQVFRQVSSPTVSVLGYFHRAGNMEFWQPPVVPTRPNPPQSRQTSFTKRSRESLELEATAYGMPSHIAEKMSRDELQEWLGTYLSFRNITKGITSRREQPQNLPVTNFTLREDFSLSTMEEYKNAQKWAESQPDYFEENYVTDYQFHFRRYDGSFKPFVIPDGAPYKDKPLRILVVNDDPLLLYSLMDEGLDDPTVSIKWISDPKETKEFLAEYPNSVDVILLDLALADYWGRSMLEVPMYVYNHHLNIPVISNSAESTSDSWLLSYNIVGQYPPVTLDFEMPELIAYLKNIVYTGRARPQ